MTSQINITNLTNVSGSTAIEVKDFAHRIIQRVSYTHRNGWIRGNNTYYWMPGGYADFRPLRSDSRIRSTWNIPTRTYGSAHMIMHYVFYRDDIEYGRYTRGGHHVENPFSQEWDIPSWGAGQVGRMGYKYRSYAEGNHNAHLFLSEYWDGGGASYNLRGQYTILEYMPRTQLNTADMPHSQTGMQASATRNNGTGGAGSAASDGLAEDRTRGLGFGWHSTTGVTTFPAICAVYLGDKYPNGAVVNQLRILAHGNSFGNFEIQGSNDSGKAGSFHTNGNWTTIISGNGGGSSSGYFDRQALDFQSTNTTPYLAYRIRITDTYRPGNVGTQFTGWASYGWELYGY